MIPAQHLWVLVGDLKGSPGRERTSSGNGSEQPGGLLPDGEELLLDDLNDMMTRILTDRGQKRCHLMPPPIINHSDYRLLLHVEQLFQDVKGVIKRVR